VDRYICAIYLAIIYAEGQICASIPCDRIAGDVKINIDRAGHRARPTKKQEDRKRCGMIRGILIAAVQLA